MHASLEVLKGYLPYYYYCYHGVTDNEYSNDFMMTIFYAEYVPCTMFK